MSDKWLWEEAKAAGRLSGAGLAHPHEFDIHGGGVDLVFPHHENEVAQSTCGFGTDIMANIWMHNGFLQVEGEKMAKSAGNFVTIRDALHGLRSIDGQIAPGWGETLRLNMLRTHYRQPINWTDHGLIESQIIHDSFLQAAKLGTLENAKVSKAVQEALEDDLNTPAAFAELTALAKAARTNTDAANELVGSIQTFFGFSDLLKHVPQKDEVREAVEKALKEVTARKNGVDPDIVDRRIEHRLKAREAKNWAEADRIRDELASMGIALKDSKDPKTGEIITTWEVARP
jgi:cysteinyl-tRNA synthetase